MAKIDWVIHLCTNGILCDECGKVENGFFPQTCNAHTHGMEKYHHMDFQLVLALPTEEIARILNTIQTTCGNRMPAESYEAVYHGELDIQTIEDAFYIFNMEHPEGYKGRSMSVSDVVEIFDPEKGVRQEVA